MARSKKSKFKNKSYHTHRKSNSPSVKSNSLSQGRLIHPSKNSSGILSNAIGIGAGIFIIEFRILNLRMN